MTHRNLKPRTAREPKEQVNGNDMKQITGTEKAAKTNRVKAIWFYGVLFLLGLLILSLPQNQTSPRSVFGYSIYTVWSGSMRSEMPEGSLIITRYMSPEEIQIGDDVTYLRKDLKTVTHRVIEIHENYMDSGVRGFRTKGIDNPKPDDRIVHAENVLGVVVFHFAGAGMVLEYVRQNPLLLVGFTAGVLLLISLLSALYKQWKNSWEKREADFKLQNKRNSISLPRFCRIAFLFSCVLFLLCSSVTPTFAWTDTEQHKTNGILWPSEADNTIKMIQISGEKTWDFPALPPGQAPETVLPEIITVLLKNQTKTVAQQTVQADASGRWRYQFTVPKYEPDGTTLISYTIDEVKVPGFITVTNGYHLINRYTGAVTMELPVIKKQIQGDSPPQDEIFGFRLTGSPGAPMPEGGDKITITGAGEAAFGKISYEKRGVYTYTVAEESKNTPGYTYDDAVYTVRVVIDELDGVLYVQSKECQKQNDGKSYETMVFTNLYQAQAEETVTVSGQKIWRYGTNKAENQPAFVVVRLYANGEEIMSFMLEESTQWQYQYTLPKFDESGKEIRYTVDEDPVPGYEKQINGFTLINTFEEAGATKPSAANPSTGDHSGQAAAVSLFLLSGAACALLYLKSRKSDPTKNH